MIKNKSRDIKKVICFKPLEFSFFIENSLFHDFFHQLLCSTHQGASILIKKNTLHYQIICLKPLLCSVFTENVPLRFPEKP